MIHYLRPSFWQAAIKDPLTWLAIAVDFVPVILVFVFGWGAAPLVLLYWAENVIIGVVTFFRIIASSLVSLGGVGSVFGFFLAAFFSVHYGMFCFGHGIFLFSFINLPGAEIGIGPPGPDAFMEMLGAIVTAYPAALYAMGLIFVFQLIAAVKDYWPGGQHGYASPQEEMFSPYGRIIVLHVGVFVGAFALLAIGDPAIGVLALILLRMAFSVLGRAWRDRDRGADGSRA
ncbi:DUF6498-containing protein [Ponticaulis sp.]|uniref:DUF6498-containing protein n=1 Tax=Ponticaulis sp. TaxID=2020902 RepID=UPI000B670142|nr:DUF6498-containing protein [Ponticaulis sp.]MAJ09737.1 hypothetical protein [Ponticaulis sp.]RPG17074.1 MAG: hypothetical protein CBC85_006465 [Hyphomonadaceae bacterium TMED125]HBJ93377.1 hypothetical protein [Hyphomonadaceae bacterium]|tara:strand:+ start:3105 stop:3794 length:690 start_codon:yes stop_codon:yes gene_type:complete